MVKKYTQICLFMLLHPSFVSRKFFSLPKFQWKHYYSAKFWSVSSNCLVLLISCIAITSILLWVYFEITHHLLLLCQQCLYFSIEPPPTNPTSISSFIILAKSAHPLLCWRKFWTLVYIIFLDKDQRKIWLVIY